jgi:hypothetical protein
MTTVAAALVVLLISIVAFIPAWAVLHRKTPAEQAMDDHEQMMALSARRKGNS